MALASMENDKVKAFCVKVSNLLSTTTDTSELVLGNNGILGNDGILGSDRLKNMLLSGENKDDAIYSLSDDIKAEIAERTYNGYKNKGAPQDN